MTNILDPRRTFSICLPMFESAPEAERPTFKFRRLNGAEYLDMLEAGEKAPNEQTNEAWAETAYKAVSMGLVDWSNQYDPATGEAIAFDLGAIKRVLTPDEALALVQKRAWHARLNGADRKN